MDKKPEFINVNNMHQGMYKCEYAVRGATVLRAEQIAEEIASGKANYSFKETMECNVGNPHALGQPPITFGRQVLSCLMSPSLIETSHFPEGVKKRAIYYRDRIRGNLGAYAASCGYKFVRENLAKALEKRDNGAPSNWEQIILTDGASAAITMVLHSLIPNSEAGIMLPTPQYPLYSATITVAGGQQVPYYLDEETGWQIKVEDLKKSYEEARKKGVKVRAIVVINPGNPTGQILDEEAMRKIIKFSYDHDLCILADEVYQQNIWTEKKQFISFKKVVYNMPEPYNKTALFSFGSCSKGFMGECGLRGGYVESYNVDPAVEAQFRKFKTISLSTNTVGQVMMDLMMNPPTYAENGKEVTDQYLREKDAIISSLKRKALAATKIFNSMKNVECQEIEGAMYCFPKIHLSQKAIQEAKRRKIAPDLLYCLEALDYTGMVTVEGTGFGQKEGTYHFRSTILITPDKRFEEALEKFREFNDAFHEKYNDEVRVARPKL